MERSLSGDFRRTVPISGRNPSAGRKWRWITGARIGDHKNCVVCEMRRKDSPPEAGMVQHFAKRRNADGTMDSICLRCFRTVASCTDRGELIEFEKGHRCRPILTNLPESRPSATILEFPPDRMLETDRRLLYLRRRAIAERFAGIERYREGIHVCK